MQESTLTQLQAKRLELITAFREHIDELRRLRQRTIEEVVPDVSSDHDLTVDEEKWVGELLEDEATLFRIFMRNKFTITPTYTFLRSSLIWRFTTIHPISIQSSQPKSPLVFLPLKPQYFDPIYRPIAILHARDVDVSSTSAVFKQVILASLERMRRNIAAINKRRRYYRKQVGDDLREVSESESRSDCAWGNTPEDLVLQYTMVVDLEGAPATSVSFDTISWYLREVQPHFYGIIGTIFVINYGWAHMGVWRVVKQILPSSVNSRIVFCKKEDLDFLQLDYKEPFEVPVSVPNGHSPPESLPQPEEQRPQQDVIPPAPKPLPGLSGIPPRLPPSRQTWREFLRMLLALYWKKWKKRLGLGFLAGVVIVVLLKVVRARAWWKRWR